MNKVFLTLFLVFFICTVNYSQVRDYWPAEGWQTKSLSEVGMNAAKINEMEQTIMTSMDYVDAFLIVKDGYLVYERYFNSLYREDDYHILCSATKSITSILIGILLKQHYIDSLGQTIMGYFPEYSMLNDDPRINQLTIKHLLSFTAGLYNDDDNAASRKPDQIEFYLSQKFVADPGTIFRYATPASQVLSAIISITTGKNAREFAAEVLFPKLGISDFYWPADQQGYTYGGFNSFFCPRDMLKFGFLYLNHGLWDGDTIVDPSYVLTCTAVHSEGGSPHGEKYGYNWWITENNGYHAYFAGGYGGQFIYVVPDLDLVVAITCNTNEHREDARFLINSHVVPAIQNSSVAKGSIHKEGSGLIVYPNPSKGEVNIGIETPGHEPVSLYITDLTGRKHFTILNKSILLPGCHTYNLSIELPPGCYFIRGNAGAKEYNEKLILSN